MDALSALAEKWAKKIEENDRAFLAEQWRGVCDQCLTKSNFPHCLLSCESRRGK